MSKIPLRRVLIGVAFLAPALFLILLTIQPQLDPVANLPLFHFYIVTFTTFSAAVVSILLSFALRDIAEARHLLAAVAFAVIGAVFFTHGLPTPGALIDYFHPAVSWSAWLTLFGGGVIFALAGLAGPKKSPAWLSVRRVTQFTVGVVVLYFTILLFAPHWLQWFDTFAAPWHRSVIFWITLAAWLFAAFRFAKIWGSSRSRVDGVLSFVALWLAYAAVSMHQFPLWQLSWWLYHFILLVGFLVTVYILLAEYEQARQFSLLRYYLAASLIVTALLALVASYLFAQFSYQMLVAEKENDSIRMINVLTKEVAATLPDQTLPSQALTAYANRLPNSTMGQVIVYNAEGNIFDPAATGFDYGSESSQTDVPPQLRADFEEALAGEIDAEILPPAPNNTANGYNPFAQSPTVFAYAPLYTNPETLGQPIGAVFILQSAQDLTQATLRARTAGLVITALSMAILFGALLLVVARADRIIATRTQELTQAYANLQQSEQMRNDLTNMIIHDLRNPLSIIYGSLGLIQYLTGPEEAEARAHHLNKALTASERMTGLINDILSVSKIEAGQLQPNISQISIANLLTEHLDGYMAQAKEEDKQLSVDCSPELTARLDPKMIGRVVENLVSNALKYTDANGQIQVSAWANNGQVRMRVRDNGDGIPDDFKQYIFAKFAQVPNTQDKIRKGTGLGLAFCGMAVELHGGEIWVEDAPGGGSDFLLWLPQNKTPKESQS